SRMQIGSNLQSPYGVHWNVAWDQEWAPRWVSHVNLIQKRGKQQPRFSAIPQFNGFNLEFNNSGKSSYDAVELSVDRPIRTNLRILTSYVYSQAKERPSMSLDFPDAAIEQIPEALTAYNVRHRLVTWGYFPFFMHSAASYSVEVRSGFPFSALDSYGRLAG